MEMVIRINGESDDVKRIVNTLNQLSSDLEVNINVYEEKKINQR